MTTPDSDPDRPPAPLRRRGRRVVIAGALLLVAGLALVAAAPALLETPAGTRMIRRGLDRAFAPGRLRFEAVRLSWFRPTRLTGVALDDPTGKAVVSAPTATLSPSLWGLVVRPKRLGTFAIEGATFDVARRADGSIDLADALGSVLARPDPLRDLTIRADDAALTVRDGATPTPLASARMDLIVNIRPSPEPLSWTVELRGRTGETLHSSGDLDRWRARPTSKDSPDLMALFRADRWPIAGEARGFEVAGGVSGRVRVMRSGGRLQVDDLTTFDPLKLSGPALRGDTLDLSRLVIECSVNGAGGAWSVEHFEAKGPLVTLSASGAFPADPDRPIKVAGRVDLAAIVGQLPRALGLPDGVAVDSGSAEVALDARPGPGPPEWSAGAKVSGLAAHRGDRSVSLQDPVTLSVATLRLPDGGGVEFAGLALAVPFAKVEAGGRVDLKEVDISGTIAPDWTALNAALADRVESGARVSGRPLTFRARGPLRPGDGAEPLVADLTAELDGADLFGMKLGATPVAVHLRGDRLAIDPVETTLNGGRLRLEPSVDLEAPGGAVVRLGSGSGLKDATVNEEVSRRVLSYVAPVLDKTTRATGRVSVSLTNAEFPIVRDAGRRATVEGSVVFQDLEFAPGPLARQVVAMVSSREPGNLRLDEPVLLSIADGRVNQRGLAVPLGDVTRIKLEGWVDFDKNIGLVASLPMTSAMFPNRPAIGEIVAGAEVKVPINGSLSAPRIDRDAFNAGLKEFGTSLLTRAAGRGALELLNNLAKPRPRDPDAPPPPTAAEKKAERIEKKNQRRMNRGLDPLPPPRP